MSGSRLGLLGLNYQKSKKFSEIVSSQDWIQKINPVANTPTSSSSSQKDRQDFNSNNGDDEDDDDSITNHNEALERAYEELRNEYHQLRYTYSDLRKKTKDMANMMSVIYQDYQRLQYTVQRKEEENIRLEKRVDSLRKELDYWKGTAHRQFQRNTSSGDLSSVNSISSNRMQQNDFFIKSQGTPEGVFSDSDCESLISGLGFGGVGGNETYEDGASSIANDQPNELPVNRTRPSMRNTTGRDFKRGLSRMNGDTACYISSESSGEDEVPLPTLRSNKGVRSSVAMDMVSPSRPSSIIKSNSINSFLTTEECSRSYDPGYDQVSLNGDRWSVNNLQQQLLNSANHIEELKQLLAESEERELSSIGEISKLKARVIELEGMLEGSAVYVTKPSALS